MKKRKWLSVSLIGALLILGGYNLLLVNVWDCSHGDETDVVRIFVNDTMKASLFRYRIDHGKYPSSREGLSVLTNWPPASSQFNLPYLQEIPLDPWANPYQYRSPGLHNPKGYDLWSMGPDGVDSMDDIGNW